MSMILYFEIRGLYHEVKAEPCGIKMSLTQRGDSEVKEKIKISFSKGYSRREVGILLFSIPVAFKIYIRI